MSETIAGLTKKINEKPNDAKLYLRRAELYFEDKKYDSALSDCDAAIAIEPENAFAYAWRARSLERTDRLDEAMESCEKAISIDGSCYLGFFVRGNVYRKQNESQKALDDYNKAIELNNKHAPAYNNRGNLYRNQKDYVNALDNYNKAIELNDQYTITYNNRGILHCELKEFDKALDDYNKSIDLNKNYAHAYRNKAYIFYLQADYDSALSDYLRAKDLYHAEKNNSGERFVDNKIEEINGILEGLSLQKEAEEAADIESVKPGEGKAIQILIGQTAAIENDIKEMTQTLNKFLAEGDSKSPEKPEFEVLRRWNSYTPIIADDHRVSKGGGYFYKAGDCGIVIDPGFNFIDNFKSAKHKFKEIDHVLITHAHNDHTTDLESILTLLHRYNRNIIGDFDNPEEGTVIYKLINELDHKPTDKDRKQLEEKAKELFLEDRRRKRISIHMTASTYKKYVNMLNLYSKNDYDITIIKAGDGIQLKYPGTYPKDNYAAGLKIKAIPAKHDDLMSDHDSVGFIIDHNNFFLIYTGDTGFDHKVEADYRTIKENAGDKEIVLLAHLGGFKTREAEFRSEKSTKDNGKAFYKYHLGRLGIAKLVEILKPTICIISEFGEEFRRTRLELVKIYNKLYEDTTFFASDIKFTINADRKIKAITSLKDIDKPEFIEPCDVLTCERRADYSLHYYKNDGLRESDVIEALVTRYFLSHS